MYKVIVSTKAEKELSKLGKSVVQLILKKIETLGINL